MDEAEGVKLMILLILGSMISGLVALASSDEMQADVRARLTAQVARWRAAPRQVLALFQQGEWRRQLTAAVAWAQGRPVVPAAHPAARPAQQYRNTPMPDFVLTPLPQLPWMAPGTHRRPQVGAAADAPPPGLDPILQNLAWYDDILDRRADPLRFPIGWSVRQDGGLDLEAGTFRHGKPYSAYNLLVSGQVGSGKDVVVRSILLALLLRNSPTDLTVAILDAKGLDYPAYADLPHVVRQANDAEEIPDALAWLDAERKRRKTLLVAAKAKNWDGADPKPFPLLVVYVSELTNLERHVERFWEWVNDHLTLDRALGIRYIVGTQTASNTPTRWRGQTQLAIVGYQRSRDDDYPNTNISLKHWPPTVAPPSQLPSGGGYFAVVLGRTVLNVRAGMITDDEEAQALTEIRARWGAAPVRSAPTELVRPSAGGPESPQNRPDSPDSGEPNQRRTSSANQFGSATPDTNALNAGSASRTTPRPGGSGVVRQQFDAEIPDTNAANAGSASPARPESAAPGGSGVVRDWFDAEIPDTNAVRASSTIAVPPPPPGTPASAAPAERGVPDTNAANASSANSGSPASPVTADAVRQLARPDLIRILALQRNLDAPGEWAFSANRIADFVGGTRTSVLDTVRAARTELPG